MILNKTPSLVAFESEIKKVTSSKHQEEVNLMTTVINMYINGFNLIDSFTFTEDNDVETAWLLLVTRSFHSMRCAIQLILMGYYGQAISLLRTITENFFICHDCVKNPETVEAILYDKYKIPGRKHALTFYAMAERTNNMKVYKSDYHHQSQVSHPTSLSLGIIRDPETNTINAAPSYQEILFLDCCEQFFRNALMMSEFMGRFLAKLSKTKVESWGETANKTCKNFADWLDSLREKYSEENTKTIK